MKNILIIIVIFVLNSCNQENNLKFNNNPVIAHRGAWKNNNVPQNSIGSLRAAIGLGCHGSEFDVHLTVDDSLIVYHDRDYHGMKIESTNYDSLVKILLDNNEKIPTLREYFIEGMKQEKTKLIVDIKTPENKQRALHTAEKVLSLVEELNVGAWVEFLTFDTSVAEYFRDMTTMPVAYLGAYNNVTDYMLPENIHGNGFKNVDYWYKHYQNNPGWINSFKGKGIQLNTWTVNKPEDMDWFMEQGFNYITTDEPELLLGLYKDKKNQSK